MIAENGWFAAEDIYEICVVILRGEDHLRRVAEEAQAIADAALTR